MHLASAVIRILPTVPGANADTLLCGHVNPPSNNTSHAPDAFTLKLLRNTCETFAVLTPSVSTPAKLETDPSIQALRWRHSSRTTPSTIPMNRRHHTCLTADSILLLRLTMQTGKMAGDIRIRIGETTCQSLLSGILMEPTESTAVEEKVDRGVKNMMMEAQGRGCNSRPFDMLLDSHGQHVRNRLKMLLSSLVD